MDQHILSVAGRDFFIDQPCQWPVSIRAASRWARTHGATAVRLSRRECADSRRGRGPARLIAEIPVGELASADGPPAGLETERRNRCSHSVF